MGNIENTATARKAARRHSPLTPAQRKANQEKRDREAGLHLVRVKVPVQHIAAVRAFAKSLDTEAAQ